MPAPRVTVVIPTYNRAHFLHEAIQSALQQTYGDFEILVVDNASTDDTGEVVANFKDSRLVYHRHPSNIGMTPNWQFVLSKPDTEFVAPLPDDDMYLPEHLASALEALDRNPPAAYYTCLAEYFGDQATGSYRPRAITDTRTPLLYFAPREAVHFLGTDTPGPMNNMVCRRAALKRLQFWGKPDYLPQDVLIMPQLMAQGGFLFSNHVTARYRMHANNASVTRHKDAILKYNCMVWHGIRWVTQFLLANRLCNLDDIESHGRRAASEGHVVPLVLALASFDSPPEWRRLARRVFDARQDMDSFSARFRLARRLGFWIFPVAEKISQRRCGWRP